MLLAFTSSVSIYGVHNHHYYYNLPTAAACCPDIVLGIVFPSVLVNDSGYASLKSCNNCFGPWSTQHITDNAIDEMTCS